MKSAKRGKHTLDPELLHITPFGLWLLIGEREYFAGFQQFPWFKEAKLEDVFKVEIPHPGHLYWPSLDIDLAVESLEFPERFPLVAKQKKK